jgi:hypothetical protein
MTPPVPLSRRRLLLGAAALAAAARPLRAAERPAAPVRPLTRGPKFHWFAYYDKLQVDPSGRYALGMEVGFEHRSPAAEDVVRVGAVDLQDGDRWIELGESRAWNWQQGCMLQWLPGSASEVLWNDREGDRFVCRILDVKAETSRTLPAPVYCVSPDASWGIAPDFRRLNDCRPGYGYAGIPDPNRDAKAPADAGIWKVDLRTGRSELLIPLAEAVKVPGLPAGADEAKHWFNHLLVSPDGSRFIFLHRWRGPKDGKGFGTRMFTAGADGKDLHVLDPHGKTSHFIWRDPTHVLAWAWHPSKGEKFYLYTDKTDRVEAVGPDRMTVNGHCSYLPGGRWILNDTYPDRERKQALYLYDTETGERVDLGRFDSPKAYAGEWRCDLHPRFAPDGRSVIIDSPHGGDGRQMYRVDISGAVKG